MSLTASADASDGGHTRVRANGQSFAIQRPITADLDSTDELIVSLKEKGYSNDAVCAQLAREGRINYDKKTVGSRYLRLKNAILEREEERLDGELTDWHDGEDEALLKADQLALAEIHDTIARTKARRWHIVAKNVQKILKKEAKYSPSACQKRFIALQHGSATIPPELDDDPTRRFEERAARILASLHDQKLKDASEKQAKEAKRLASDNLKLQKALEKKDRADKRAKDAEEKARIAIEQAAKRAQSAQELEDARKTQADQIQALRQGKVAPRAPSKPARPSAVVKLNSSSDILLSNNGTKAKPDGPRSHLQLKELRELCSRRGLTQSGTKTSILERLRFDDSTIPTSQLKSLLQKHNVSTEGTRDELQERLAQADANNSAWGQRFAGKTGKGNTTSKSKRNASTQREARAPKRTRASDALADMAATTMVMTDDEADAEESFADRQTQGRNKSHTPKFEADDYLDFSGGAGADEGVGNGIGSDFGDNDLSI